MCKLSLPYVIDSWSGEVTELAQYHYKDGCTIFPVDIDYANIGLFAFEAVSEETENTIMETDAALTYMSEDGPVIRVTENGTYETVMSDGTEITTEVEDLAPAEDITGWNLNVVSWTAGEEILSSVEKIGDLTTENKATGTDFVATTGISLDTIAPWNDIDELGDKISGNGIYTAEFEWDSSMADGAYIDFGETLDQSMTVYINDVKVGGTISDDPAKAQISVTGTIFDETGKEVEYTAGEGRTYYTGGVNWDKPLVDVGKYLQDGTNTIMIEYNSSITNAALAAGIIEERSDMSITWYGSPAIWWGADVTYRTNGPEQAVLIPYRDIALNK